jgi:uncharacterized protein (TIGR02678 family)
VSSLRDGLDREQQIERSRAIRTLLARPMLNGDAQPDLFALVRKHSAALRTWFDTHTGWQLLVEPRQGYARLVKVTDRPDASRPARRPRGARAPFDRRRYGLFCLIAAELLTTPVTTIGLLADRIQQATAAEPEIATYDSARYEDRKSYVDALRLLEQLGVVTATDGSTEAYLDQADVKVLYRVDATRLTRLLAVSQLPIRLEQPDLAELTRQPRYGDAPDPTADVADSQRNMWLRHTIVRRLLSDPVVYHDELTPAQLAYLNSLTGRRLIRQAVAEAGFELEERAEGMLAADPDGIATDDRFPAEGLVKQSALLLLDVLLGARPHPVAMDELTGALARRMVEVPGWARTYRDEPGPSLLCAEAVGVLVGFGLAAREQDAVSARPAAARYAVGHAEVRRTNHSGATR